LLGNFNVTGNQLANRLNGSNGINLLSGLEGDDSISGFGGNDVLSGGDGRDTLLGGTGNDGLNGGDGDDLLNGGTGADQMVGGAGDDIYLLDDVGDQVSEWANGVDAGGVDTLLSSVSVSANAGIEIIRLQGADAINAAGDASDNIINGNDGANLLQGNDGNDLLTGGLGNDTLEGGTGDDGLFGDAGVDIMRGGIGDDSYHITDVGDAAIELDGQGYDSVYTTVNDITLGNFIEDLWLQGNTLKGTGNDQANGIAGNEFNNRLYGLGGDDLLLGDAGFDGLWGGAGADTLSGGTELDFLYGGDGGDTYLIDVVDDILTDSSVDGAGTDRVVFLSATYDKLWFEVSGTNLLVTNLDTGDQAAVIDYAGNANRIEEFVDATNGLKLDDAHLGTLISAMSQFGAAPADATQLAAAQQALSTTYQQTWLAA